MQRSRVGGSLGGDESGKAGPSCLEPMILAALGHEPSQASVLDQRDETESVCGGIEGEGDGWGNRDRKITTFGGTLRRCKINPKKVSGLSNWTSRKMPNIYRAHNK